MKGISSQAAGTLTNKFKFNGGELQNQEFSDLSGLEMYDAHYRQLDPQLGHWWQLDPYMEAHPNISPYAFVNDNPMNYCDPFGLDSVKTKVNPQTGTATATNADGSTGTYVVGQNGTLVGTGMNVTDAPVEVANHHTNNTGTSYTGLWLWGMGYGADKTAAKMFNRTTWYNLNLMRSYSQKYFGNQYQLANTVKSAKGVSKVISRGFKIGGWGIALYNEKDILFNSGYSNTTKTIETASNAYSTLGGVYGAAWGFGWEVGRVIAQTDWYNQNVRPGLQDFYRSIGIKIEGDPDYSILDKVDTSPKK